MQLKFVHPNDAFDFFFFFSVFNYIIIFFASFRKMAQGCLMPFYECGFFFFSSLREKNFTCVSYLSMCMYMFACARAVCVCVCDCVCVCERGGGRELERERERERGN